MIHHNTLSQGNAGAVGYGKLVKDIGRRSAASKSLSCRTTQNNLAAFSRTGEDILRSNIVGKIPIHDQCS